MNTYRAEEANNRTEEPLESWKEIAAYLGRQVKTAQRWEKEEGLPVHRHSHNSRSSVYAYASEIDAWRAGRRTIAEPPATWASPRPLAVGITTLLCLIMIGSGIRPIVASAQGGPAVRQIWRSEPGDEVDANRPSADGRYLCFTDWGTGNINVRDLTTGTNRRLTDNGGLSEGGSGDYGYVCAISPDDREAAYYWSAGKGKERRNELRTIPLSGKGSPRTIPNFSDYAEPEGWSPDGKQLLVIRSRPGNTTEIVMVSISDGSVHALRSFPWGKVRATMSPDGRFVAYHTPADAKTQARDIFILATDGSAETALIQHPADDCWPVWTPDGSHIVFLSDRTGNSSLWSIAVKDGKPSSAAELVKADIGAISPLGITKKGALYYSPSVTDRRNVYRANLDENLKISGKPEIAIQGFLNSNSGPALSPDGQHLAYYSQRPGRLYLVIRALGSGEEKEISLGRGFSELLIFGAAPQWFPDGRSVLAISRESEQSGFGFYRVDLESGRIELLHHSSRIQNAKASLSPDGKSIFHIDQGTGLLRFDLENRSDTEMSGGLVDALAVSPDGKRIIYSVRMRDGAEHSVRVMPAEASNPGQAREIFLTPQATNFSAWTWSPDQRYLIFGKGTGGAATRSELWRIPVAGGQAEPIGLSMPGRILSPSVSAGGRRIFFTLWERNPEELWALENFLPKASRMR